MKKRLLEYLACPSCSADIELLSVAKSDGEEILEGDLACASCQRHFAVVRGVPRFADLGSIEEDKAATASSFGWEWKHFTQEDELYGEQMLGWLDPVKAEFFKDKVVLDGGCGKGRHMRLAAHWGARDVVGIDLSDAVESAFAATRGSTNMHVVQADLCFPPVKRVFDYAYTIGVIHHLLDPSVGFRALASKVKPGGHFSVWVYGAENNRWITTVISPLRERFTSRMNRRALLHLSKLPTAAVYAASKLVYGPLNRTQGGAAFARRLFYNDYMNTISAFGWREQHTIVFDHLVAPTANYISREEFERWWQDIKASDVHIGWHNKNSWRGTGRIND
ncbi:MAG TPA: methyltransferase domain-containing protein [Pyrinomonadaceae bacterium]|jgi:SAM-dependent methyltransferase|nr:methyltransferase domain-containing protein [Pyrinomonadaceae bacterium]